MDKVDKKRKIKQRKAHLNKNKQDNINISITIYEKYKKPFDLFCEDSKKTSNVKCLHNSLRECFESMVLIEEDKMPFIRIELLKKIEKDFIVQEYKKLSKNEIEYYIANILIKYTTIIDNMDNNKNKFISWSDSLSRMLKTFHLIRDSKSIRQYIKKSFATSDELYEVVSPELIEELISQGVVKGTLEDVEDKDSEVHRLLRMAHMTITFFKLNNGDAMRLSDDKMIEWAEEFKKICNIYDIDINKT